jgi:hypothetical protein
MLVYFMTIWSILLPFGIFCGHLVYFPSFGMLYQEKSGNTDQNKFRNGLTFHFKTGKTISAENTA